MSKLAKNMYTTAKGERKLNCYLVHIPKKLVDETNIDEDDNIKVYVENDKIIIKKA